MNYLRWDRWCGWCRVDARSIATRRRCGGPDMAVGTTAHNGGVSPTGPSASGMALAARWADTAIVRASVLSPVRLRLVAVGAAAAGLGMVGAPVLAGAGHWQHPALVVALGLLVGWSFVGVGLFAWWRRP